MNNKQFFTTTGILFSLIALLHLFRLVRGWEAVIGGFTVPLWFSGVALIVAGYLAVTAWRLRK